MTMKFLEMTPKIKNEYGIALFLTSVSALRNAAQDSEQIILIKVQGIKPDSKYGRKADMSCFQRLDQIIPKTEEKISKVIVTQNGPNRVLL
jgi:hypothetical protein